MFRLTPKFLLACIVLTTYCPLTTAQETKPSVENTAGLSSTTSLKQRLHNAKIWMYQIQNLNETGAIETLASSNYPLLVLEPTRTDRDEVWFDTKAMLDKLRLLSSGEKRVLLAYIDIGQAEEWRTYWDINTWKPPQNDNPGNPDFIITNDPDGWAGNYPVAYWDKRWKNIWLGPSGLIASLAKDGFDGVYLDWVEAYDDLSIIARAKADKVNPEQEMIQFIEEIRAAGRAVQPDFLVIAQNAPYLLDTDPTRYAKAIDGLAMEDTWFRGDGDSNWTDPAGGDIENTYTDDYSTSALLNQYTKYIDLGLPVFTVDYCLDPANAVKVYRDSRLAGFRPIVTRVSLSRMTETPLEISTVTPEAP